MMIAILLLVLMAVYLYLYFVKPETVINTLTKVLQMNEVDAGKTSAIILAGSIFGIFLLSAGLMV